MRPTLKILVCLILATSFATLIFPELQIWLSLSRFGMSQLYVWQLVTYAFFEPPPLSLGWFLELAFLLYLLWNFGSSLLERTSPKRFFGLYFGAIVAGGLASLLAPHGLLAGIANPIYALLLSWMILNPYSQLLFFSIPVKAHWLILGLIALSLFSALTTGHFAQAISLIASLLFAYLFTLLAWRKKSPFSFLHPFENLLFRLLERKSSPYHKAKIYDIKSGAPVLSDDQFMDAMLEQISRLGENSLTPEQKKRMKQISERKK